MIPTVETITAAEQRLLSVPMRQSTLASTSQLTVSATKWAKKFNLAGRLMAWLR